MRVSNPRYPVIAVLALLLLSVAQVSAQQSTPLPKSPFLIGAVDLLGNLSSEGDLKVMVINNGFVNVSVSGILIDGFEFWSGQLLLKPNETKTFEHVVSFNRSAPIHNLTFLFEKAMPSKVSIPLTPQKNSSSWLGRYPISLAVELGVKESVGMPVWAKPGFSMRIHYSTFQSNGGKQSDYMELTIKSVDEESKEYTYVVKMGGRSMANKASVFEPNLLLMHPFYIKWIEDHGYLPYGRWKIVLLGKEDVTTKYGVIKTLHLQMMGVSGLTTYKIGMWIDPDTGIMIKSFRTALSASPNGISYENATITLDTIKGVPIGAGKKGPINWIAAGAAFAVLVIVVYLLQRKRS